MAILDVAKRKALLIRGQHTAVRHQKSGNKADGGRQQQEDHQVLAQFVPKLPQDAFSQGIFHSAPPYHSRSSAAIRCSLRWSLRMTPFRIRTTRSAMSLMLCVTMMTVLPYLWFTVSMSFKISLEVW